MKKRFLIFLFFGLMLYALYIIQTGNDKTVIIEQKDKTDKQTDSLYKYPVDTLVNKSEESPYIIAVKIGFFILIYFLIIILSSKFDKKSTKDKQINDSNIHRKMRDMLLWHRAKDMNLTDTNIEIPPHDGTNENGEHEK